MRKPLLAAIVLLFFRILVSAESPPPVFVQAIPAGHTPIGLDAGEITQLPTGLNTIWAGIANSGENSVSLLPIEVSGGLAEVAGPAISIPGVPSPYGVTACIAGSPATPGTEPLRFIVTSPTTNTVFAIDAAQQKVVGSASVGSMPYSTDCDPKFIYVSNYGDSSVSVLNVNTMAVVTTIPNVPGSRTLHGVMARYNGTGTDLWIAGTDASVVTILDGSPLSVLATVSVDHPSFVRYLQQFFSGVSNRVMVGSLSDNAVYAFSPSGLNLVATISNIPTPQDFSEEAFFAQLVSSGPGNSVAEVVGSSTTFIPNIPGAAGIAGGYWTGIGNTGPAFAFGKFYLVTSAASNQVFLIQPLPAPPSNFSITNGASFGGGAPLAPAALASAFGATGLSQNFTASGLPLPDMLGGTTLRVGGSLSFNSANNSWVYSSTGALQAPLLYASPNQINFQIPPGIAPDSAIPAQLTKPDGTTLLTTLNITAAAPGIFTVLQNGQGQAAVLNQDNTSNFGTNPAAPGSVIQIYATGAGATMPTLMPGEPAPASGNPLVLTNVQPTVTIGGQTAQVQFSGMAPGFVGLWQINAVVPQSVTPGNAVPLVISAGGATSNTVTIAVQ